MAKLILLALFVVIVVVIGASAEEYESSVDEHEVKHVDNRLVRVRRVTCDLLSAGNWVQDTACAANCLRLGNRGGHCSKGVCRCRK